MDFNTVMMLAFTFFGTLAIGAVKAYERVTAPNSVETWDKAKFGIFTAVAGAIMLIEYLSSGIMAFPTDAIINTGVVIVTPIASLFGLTYAAIMGGSLIKRDVIVPVLSKNTPVTAAKPVQGNPTNLPDGGCTVSPSIGGKSFQLIYGLPSPSTVDFDFFATQPTTDHSGYTSVDVDWDDGTVQKIPLSMGKARVSHVFVFDGKGTKYTGKTFNPIFTFNENTGEKFVLNANGTMVEIGVEAP